MLKQSWDIWELFKQAISLYHQRSVYPKYDRKWQCMFTNFQSPGEDYVMRWKPCLTAASLLHFIRWSKWGLRKKSALQCALWCSRCRGCWRLVSVLPHLCVCVQAAVKGSPLEVNQSMPFSLKILPSVFKTVKLLSKALKISPLLVFPERCVFAEMAFHR